MKKDKTTKGAAAEIEISRVNDCYGEGGVIFSEIRAEFPLLSGCRGAEEMNAFYATLSERLSKYASEELRAVGEGEFSELGEGVARFRFRRLTLCHGFSVTYSDERYVSFLRTLTLRRGSGVLFERAFGEVFDTVKGRFVPPETFTTRAEMRRMFASEPKIKPTLENKANFYTDGKRVVFLFSGDRAGARYAAVSR